MSEIERLLREEAEHAETHADAPLRPEHAVRRPGRERSRVLSVRLAPEEMVQLTGRAAELGIGPSTLARSFIVTALGRDDMVLGRPDVLNAGVELRELEDMLRRVLHDIEERQRAARE